MFGIIIERSKEAMQIVSIFPGIGTDECRAIANRMNDEELINDYDVFGFESLVELNKFLLDNLKI